MKIYFDTEFIDTGTTIELLSIGMVAEDGREYYAVVDDLALMTNAWNTKSGGEYWLRNNVMNSLPINGSIGDYYLCWDANHPDFDNIHSRGQIRDDVLAFLRESGTVEFWAWFAAYDHVALSQLFGRMIDLPMGLPMWTNDIKQEHKRLGYPRIPEQLSGVHNALSDARWNKEVAEYLEKLDGPIHTRIGYL
jgi:3' exoribonuclease, RNase T-like